MPARNSSMELSSPAHSSQQDATQPERRKSGRVSKAPVRLSPSITKRKHNEINGEGEDESDQGTSNDDDEDEADEEETRAERRKKRQASQKKNVPAKRPKVNGGATDLAIRTAQKKPSKPRKRKPRPSAVETGGLYGEIFGGNEDHETIAASWLARVPEHESNAVKEVINVVLRASGCNILATSDDIEDTDNVTHRLSDIQEEFIASSAADYPLIAKGKQGHTFKQTLMDFFKAFLKTLATEGTLYGNPPLLENVQIWLSSMSSASNRPFRHTATVVSLAIIEALAETTHGYIEAQATALRQAEGEQRKPRGGNKERVKKFNAEATKAHERSEDMIAMIKDWFDTVFVHRYRDVDSKIRCDCVQALGVWIPTLPDLFLDSAHLRYLGWCLSDPSPAVRKEAVKALIPLHKDDDKIGTLRQFTERFRPRVVEIATRDAEPEIRAAAIELLDILRAKELLEPNDVDTIGRLIYDADSKVREAVVPFFAASVEDMYQMKYDDLGDQEAIQDNISQDAGADFEVPRLEWLHLKALAELMTTYDVEEEIAQIERGHLGSADVLIAAGLDSRYTLAAQSLLDDLPQLKSWEILAGFLLFDHSSTNKRGANETIVQLKKLTKLTEQEEVMLLDVLNVSVKACLFDVVDQNTSSKKSKRSKSELQQIEETRDTAAQRLAALIPRLLGKFGAEPESASAVLRLERVLNLEVFQQLRQDSTTFSALLDNVKKQFMEHENQFVIAEASAALAHASGFEELEEITSGKMQALWDDTCYNLVALTAGEEVATRGSLNHAVALSVSNTLMRISNLASISNCIEPFHTPRTYKPSKKRRNAKALESAPVVPIELILKMVNRGVPSTEPEDTEMNVVEDTLVLHVYKCVLFYFLWQSSELKQTQQIDRDAVYTLTDRRSSAINYLTRALKHRRAVDDVRVQAATTLLDLHLAYATFRHKDGDEDDTSPTAELGRPVPDRTISYLLRTFSSAERDFARKAGKRIDTEPEADEDPVDDDPEDSEADEEAHANGDGGQTRSKQSIVLVAEQRFCVLASKIALALVGKVIDESTDLGKKVRQRLLKNTKSLGPNYREVCALLTKSEKKKAAPKNKATAQINASRSAELVEESDEDDQEVDEAADEERQQAEEAAEHQRHEDEMDIERDPEADSVVGD